MTVSPCPCGSGVAYAQCCRPILRGDAPAATAEALMRSRYTAYVRRDAPYLLRTWHPSTAPHAVEVDDAVWLGLDVLGTEAGGAADARGVVDFVAHYERPDGSVASARESSKFVRAAGVWVYVDGDVSAVDTPPSMHRG